MNAKRRELDNFHASGALGAGILRAVSAPNGVIDVFIFSPCLVNIITDYHFSNLLLSNTRSALEGVRLYTRPWNACRASGKKYLSTASSSGRLYILPLEKYAVSLLLKWSGSYPSA